MQAVRRIFVAATAAVLLGACAPATEQAINNLPARPKTQLVVQNKNWMEVAVYLVRSGSRTRLGNVASMSKGQFNIPESYVLGVSDIQVQADPVGSNRTFVSAPIQVFPGARVELTIENSVQLSSFAVR
ncbi:MAG TPA: hypothetical protein VM100_02185 [Longimicrobiales bacterium]|nr:hypothetical protein [Longimicrobiales bacterium]